MRRYALAVAALSLGACQTVNDITGGSPAPAVDPVVSAPAVVQPSAPTSPVAPSSGLTGMTADALRAAWGEPSLKRNETGAELWHYSSRGTCTLLVYFYANASNVMTVTHAEAVPGGSDDAAVASCARTIGKPPVKPIS
jgi:hypothetical protein